MDKWDQYLKYLFNQNPTDWFDIQKGEKKAPTGLFTQEDQDKNTDALINLFNMVQFDEGPEGWAKTKDSKEAIKDFEYSNVAIPFGYENQDAFPYEGGLVAGMRIPGWPLDRTIVPGQVDPQTWTHEALHKYYYDRGMFPNEHEEEKAVRKQDFINAAKNQSPGQRHKSATYINSRYGLSGLLEMFQ